MNILFIEDFPHGVNNASGYLAYDYAKRNPNEKIDLIVTESNIIESKLSNLTIYDNLKKINHRNYNFCFLDASVFSQKVERWLDSSCLPLIVFSLINIVESNYSFQVASIPNANSDKLIREKQRLKDLLCQTQVNQL